MIAVAVLVTRVAVHSSKVGVDDGLFCRNAASGVVYEQRVKQVETDLIEISDNVCDIRPTPLGERGLEVGERCDARPVLLIGCAENTG